MMRLSVVKGEAGYEAWRELQAEGRTAHVYLDGVEQKFVYMADEEAGRLRRAVLDENGRAKPNLTRDAILTETLSGAVRIELEAVS